MPATIDEVKQLIASGFEGSNVDDLKEENHRVTGTILWDGFKGMDAETRNKLVLERVRNKLGLKGLNVGFLFPRAPGDKLW